MEIKLRQRLIGAVVLAAIIIIVVPTLFKSPNTTGQKSITLTSTIPPEPAKPAIQTISKVSPDDPNTNPDLRASTIALGNNPLQNNAANSTQPQTVTPVTLPPQPQPAPAANPVETIQSNQAQQLGQATTALQSENVQQSAPVSSATAPAKPKAPVQQTPAAVKTVHKVVKPQPKFAAANTKSPANTADNSKFAANAVAESLQDSMPAANAWVVQLGSFSNTNNAKELEKTLRSHGFTAFSRNIKTKKGTLMRVMIGPETQRDKAEKILSKLTTDLKLNGVIVPFDALQAK